MKILCVSDQIDPLIYSNTLKDRFPDLDLVVSAGDLPMDYLGFIVTTLNKPLLFVFGNHNLKELKYYRPEQGERIPSIHDRMMACDSGATYIGFKVRREQGLTFMGLGGSMRYNNGNNQFTEAQMLYRIVKKLPRLLINRLLHGRWIDVLLTHAPPAGIHDKEDPCHRGFRAFLWFMRVFKPRYLIHGHIHLYDLNDVRTTRYGETLVVNAYSHFLIDTEDLR